MLTLVWEYNPFILSGFSRDFEASASKFRENHRKIQLIKWIYIITLQIK